MKDYYIIVSPPNSGVYKLYGWTTNFFLFTKFINWVKRPIETYHLKCKSISEFVIQVKEKFEIPMYELAGMMLTTIHSYDNKYLGIIYEGELMDLNPFDFSCISMTEYNPILQIKKIIQFSSKDLQELLLEILKIIWRYTNIEYDDCNQIDPVYLKMITGKWPREILFVV